MEHTFTLASLFMIFVPMPLLIIFSLISVFNQMQRDKNEERPLLKVSGEKTSFESRNL
jgi:hypothetical protein